MLKKRIPIDQNDREEGQERLKSSTTTSSPILTITRMDLLPLAIPMKKRSLIIHLEGYKIFTL